MNESGNALRKEPTNQPFASLSHGRRRHTMAVLLARSTPVTERELASELAESTPAGSGRAVSRGEARINLRHVDLPKLADAGLLSWNEADGTVTSCDHLALDDTTLERVIETEAGRVDGPATNVLNQRRRTVLAVLESRNGSRDRAELAGEVAAREAEGEPSTEAVEEVAVRLHHVDLPKLDEAGLVEYDADDGTVSRVYPRPPQ